MTVLAAADTLGGGTRSSDLTLPGLIHDECSAAHPLAVDTAFSRRFDLAAHEPNWLWPEMQYTHPLDGGAGAAPTRSHSDAYGPGPQVQLPVVTEIIAATTSAAPPRTQRELVLASLPARP